MTYTPLLDVTLSYTPAASVSMAYTPQAGVTMPNTDPTAPWRLASFLVHCVGSHLQKERHFLPQNRSSFLMFFFP